MLPAQLIVGRLSSQNIPRFSSFLNQILSLAAIFLTALGKSYTQVCKKIIIIMLTVEFLIYKIWTVLE